MAGAVELEDRTVVDESVDDRGGGHCVGKDLRPLLESEIGRQGDTRGLVTLRDDLEEQVVVFSFEGDVPEFIDEQEAIAFE